MIICYPVSYPVGKVYSPTTTEVVPGHSFGNQYNIIEKREKKRKLIAYHLKILP